ncbi:HDOD domain-containing protein [Pseudoalteromonas sp. MMG010]|uniref:EAL and HDOD domain-containing protein n=1 Tax=Pseudoalteromonas sp. MMG010 TaxID=2822685 RepID=UPI001FFCE323|nr:HDOD domain-containing protein [Pseudoalteromonas sp. MMG010]
MTTNINQYIARQAIFNADKSVYAYELLYRDSSKNSFPIGTSDELATSRVFLNSLMFIGVERLTANKPTFVNLSTDSLLAETPKVLEPKSVVIEIVERTDNIAQVVKSVSKLKKEGYIFALDDYDGDPKWEPLLSLVNFIKLEIDETTVKTVMQLKLLKHNYPHIKVIVERIETYKQFKQLKAAGCMYFQGYFFARPEMLSSTRLDPSKTTVFELLSCTAKSDLCFEEIHQKVSRDISVTARILKLANARLGKNNLVITSIPQAVVFLGEDAIRQFVRILAISELGSNKPVELTKLALTRAKLLSLLLGDDHNLSQQGYLVGLLSLLDAMLDLDLEMIVSELGLDKRIANALLLSQGKLGECLALVRAIEADSADVTNLLLNKAQGALADDVFNEYILESIFYADEIIESMAS